MPSLFHRIGRCMLVAALFFALGGHWALLQTVAWGVMIVDYSQAATLGDAVQKTFDGKHPCEICKQVRDGWQKKPDAVVVVLKVELFYEEPVLFLAPTGGIWELAIEDSAAQPRAQQPVAPPPRIA